MPWRSNIWVSAVFLAWLFGVVAVLPQLPARLILVGLAALTFSVLWNWFALRHLSPPYRIGVYVVWMLPYAGWLMENGATARPFTSLAASIFCGGALLGALLARELPLGLRFGLAMAAATSVLGRAGGSDAGPGGMIALFAQWGMSPEFAEGVTIAIRKAVHFGYFGLLAWLACRALLDRHGKGEPFYGALAAAALWPIGHAAIDEWRQSLSPGRTGSPWDVALDTAGALFFVLLAARQAARRPAIESDAVSP